MQVSHSLDEVVKALVELAARVSAMDGQTPVITMDRSVADDVDELRARLAALEAKPEAVSAQPADTGHLEQRIADLEARPAVVQPVPSDPVDLSPVWQRICDLENRPQTAAVDLAHVLARLDRIESVHTIPQAAAPAQPPLDLGPLVQACSDLMRRVSDLESLLAGLAREARAA